MAVNRFYFFGSYSGYRPFIIRVNSGADSQITIPTTGGGYNYDLEVQGGASWTGLTGNHTINFPSANTDYFIEISGEFPRIYINYNSEREKFLDIIQWGDIEWKSFDRAFFGCSNLQVSATDVPNLSNVTNMDRAFNSCILLTTLDVSNWDVSNVLNFNQWILSSGVQSNIDFSNPITGSISATNTNNMVSFTGVKSLKLQASNVVNNPNPFEYASTGMYELLLIGQKSPVNIQRVSSTLIGVEIDNLFTSLGTANTGATITITTSQNTSGIDTTIATSKGWTIIVV